MGNLARPLSHGNRLRPKASSFQRSQREYTMAQPGVKEKRPEASWKRASFVEFERLSTLKGDGN